MTKYNPYRDPKTMIDVPCDGCGKIFQRNKSYVKVARTWGRKVFCSPKCARRYNSQIMGMTIFNKNVRRTRR